MSLFIKAPCISLLSDSEVRCASSHTASAQPSGVKFTETSASLIWLQCVQTAQQMGKHNWAPSFQRFSKENVGTLMALSRQRGVLQTAELAATNANQLRKVLLC